MNLIGNAVKFTANGSVRVGCSVDHLPSSIPGEVHLKFEIQYGYIFLWSECLLIAFVETQASVFLPVM
jgi:signal transduction histidine kinase